MQETSDRKARKRRLLPWMLPVAAIVLAGLFFLAVHPVSGFIGGLFFLAFGWAIPTVVNLLLSAWVALLFRGHWLTRVILFVAVSFVLGVNTWLPELFKARPNPQVAATIVRAFPASASLAIDDRLMVARQNNMLDYAFSPTPLGIGVGGDEGCGCMYFVYGGRIKEYYGQVQQVIHQRNFSRISGQHAYIQERNPDADIVHFDFDISQPPDVSGTVNLTINIYRAREKIATYEQRDLPTISLANLNIGRDKGLSNVHFFAYVTSMLIHRNIWMTWLEKHFTADAATPFKEFLDKALPSAN